MFTEPTDTTFEILIDNEIMNTQRPLFFGLFLPLWKTDRKAEGERGEDATKGSG